MFRRRIGPNGPEISQVTYGTMRMRPEVDGVKAHDLLCELHDDGIDTHHSSFEYDAHPLYLESLKKARATGRKFLHIVKLSEPSWDTDQFDASKLEKNIDRELSELGTEQIASLQWLFRTPNASDTNERIASFLEQQQEINDTMRKLKREGKVANVSVFPYAQEFAGIALKILEDTTLCTYFNVWEKEAVKLSNAVSTFLAIRPLIGFTPDFAQHNERKDTRVSIADALIYPLLHPKVATVIISMNGRNNRCVVSDTCANVIANPERFSAFANQ